MKQYRELKAHFINKAVNIAREAINGEAIVPTPIGGYYDNFELNEKGLLEAQGMNGTCDWSVENFVKEYGKIFFRNYLMKHRYTADKATWLWHNCEEDSLTDCLIEEQ